MNPGPKPHWLRRRLPPAGQNRSVHSTVRHSALFTVCVEAQCPNQMECYGRGEATFLLLGPHCTRGCTFCAVDKSAPAPVDPNEPGKVAEAVAGLRLEYCVLTMVTRDDLADGGAAHVAATIAAIRARRPGILIEVLISDLGGNREALGLVLSARPEVLNHNVETVPRLYRPVRPQADYRRSLALLSAAAQSGSGLVTKSGIMLGLGETKEEVLEVMDDLRAAGCALLTLGHYLAPSERHYAVRRWVTPDEFADYEREALARGFAGVASAPYVRSSYQAGQLYRQAISVAGPGEASSP